jgi:uncharacterized GH25 family protein
MKQFLMAAAVLMATTAPALAYTAYLKPNQFWSDGGAIEVQASYANQFFTPAVALPANITVLDPDGNSVLPDRVAVDSTATNLATSLGRFGTYRISTGEIGIDGGWRPQIAGEVLPEDTPTATLQTVTVSDLYLSHSRTTRGPLDRTIGRLAIKPITHPNQVVASTGFQVEVLFDGAPLANSAIVIYANGDMDNDLDTFVPTDAAGRATIPLPAPGQYVIAARHRANAPAGAAAAVQSYTTTLTFEAMAAPRAETAPPPEDNRRRRRRN